MFKAVGNGMESASTCQTNCLGATLSCLTSSFSSVCYRRFVGKMPCALLVLVFIEFLGGGINRTQR